MNRLRLLLLLLLLLLLGPLVLLGGCVTRTIVKIQKQIPSYEKAD